MSTPPIIPKASSPTPKNTEATNLNLSSTQQAAISLSQNFSSEPSTSSSTTSAPYRQLNVKDALSYLDQVKMQFADHSEVYNRFLDIMKDFKSQSIDTPGVIERVSTLFRGHPSLITGFNTFLPPGYRIEPTNNPLEPIKVITPSDAFRNQSPLPPVSSIVKTPPVPPPPPTLPRPPKHNLEFNHAINYVNKIKNRFAPEPDTYKQFLEILQTYKQSKPIQEVYAQVQELFKGAPDLLDEFKQFLPDTSVGRNPAPPPPAAGVAPPRPTSGPESFSPTGGSYSKKGTKRSSVSGYPPAPNPVGYSSTLLPVKKKPKMQKGASMDKPGTMEELEFFEKVKKAIGNKATYNEFLKVLNLFSQEIIDAKVLIEKVAPFLERSPELLEWFKRFVKYEDEDVVWNIPQELPEFDPSLCKRSGNSYRLLPKDYPRGTCSGRDDLCNEVLNDDWISHPLFTSENGHFATSRKNIYEEALHKCEEERYDFDLNIEANLYTIALLEPIAKQLSTMTPEEKSRFKLPLGLGGTSTSIYQRAIKKIYDKDRGNEIIEALHVSPAVAVPVVLKRLKQKDEEWKRAQREWNKVWREIDAKNFAKALDYQGVTFKATDKKAITTKALVTEIETVYQEQRGKSKQNSNEAPRYQFDFSFKNSDLFRDCRKIIVQSVDTSVGAEHVGDGNKKTDKIKVNEFLKYFVGRLFWVDTEETSTSDTEQDDEEEEAEEETKSMDTETDAEDDGSKKKSLRRKVLEKKNEEGEDSERKVNGFNDPIMSSLPVIKPQRASYTFYTNTSFYVFIRLFQMLYSRLAKLKELSNELANNPPAIEKLNPVAIELGLQKSQEELKYDVNDRYSTLISNLLDLIDGKMEAQEFEESARNMFLTCAYMVFTLDKIAAAISKQIISILNDGCCTELLALYYKERNKETTSARQEAIYRLASEAFVEDENLYRLEWFISEKTMTIQLIAKEDQLTESISSEEKWSVYVDHFVQLSSTEGMWAKHQEPFLHRNLPGTISDDAPNIETKSGLELKICVNTYKIFFVDNTEDYFYRRRGSGQPRLVEKTRADNQIRSRKFAKFLESNQGWRQNDSDQVNEQRLKEYSQWINK